MSSDISGFYSEIKELLEKYKNLEPAMIVNFLGAPSVEIMTDYHKLYQENPNYDQFWIETPTTSAKHAETALVLGTKNWFKARSYDEEGRLRWLLHQINRKYYTLNEVYYEQD